MALRDLRDRVTDAVRDRDPQALRVARLPARAPSGTDGRAQLVLEQLELRARRLGTAEVVPHLGEPDLRAVHLIADPNIAYLLMMAGLLGLYVEFTHPGAMFPGVAGAICLLLALTALHVLPLNSAGPALLGLGVALLVAEAFLPTCGLLGVGGIVAFVMGSLFLFDTAETGVAVNRGLVFGVSGAVGLVMLVVASLVVRSQRARPRHGVAGMVGQIGVVSERLAPTGRVVVGGESWAAESDDPVDAGERVEVTGVEGLRLRVRRTSSRT